MQRNKGTEARQGEEGKTERQKETKKKEETKSYLGMDLGEWQRIASKGDEGAFFAASLSSFVTQVPYNLGTYCI